MCGRYRLHKRDARQLEAEYGVDATLVTAGMVLDRPEVSPGTEVLSVIAGDEGDPLVPHLAQWGVTHPKFRQMINAKSEKLDQPFWRSQAQNRTVLPASGFFEWSGPKGSRTKHYFETDEPFAFAAVRCDFGLGEGLALVTTEANEVVEPFHDRMPVMLRPDELAPWVYSDFFELEEALGVAGPWDGELAVHEG